MSDSTNRIFDFYQLEDRILLSGEGLEGAEAAPESDLAQALLAEMEQADGQAPEDSAVAAALNPTAAAASEGSRDSEDLADAPTFDPALPQEVVFIDSGVEDAETLLAGLRNDGDQQTQWLIVELEADRDGVKQISETLAQLSGVDAVHLVSHGDGRGIQLGDAWLDVDTAESYAAQIAGWAGSMDSDADLLIYGCDLASTSDGQTLIESLAALSGCDVAASDDATGHQDLGGDWDLEYATGEIQTSIAFAQPYRQQWYHTLDITSGLVSHHTFDSDASDSSGNGNDGNLVGSPVFASGTIGGAVELDYSNGEDYVEIPNSATLENVQEGDYTLAAWFRPDSTPPGSGSDNDANYGVLIKTGWHTGIYFDGNNRFNFDHVLSDNSAIGVVSTNTFTPGQYYHVAGVVDRSAGTVSLYVNGQLEGSSNFTPDAAAREYGTQTWKVGIANPGGGDWGWPADGAIDDARIYSRALTTSDIGELQALGSASVSFQQGTGGYTATQDTFLSEGNPSTNYGNNSSIDVDLDQSGGLESQGLIRFDSIVGSGAGEIPVEAIVTSASLTVNTTGSSVGTMSLHQMLTSWDESTATWNSMSGGLSADGTEMAITADAQISNPPGTAVFNGLEETVQRWVSGGNNYGWGILNDSTDGWDFTSSEGTTAPILTVNYVLAGSQTSTNHTVVVDTTADIHDGDVSSIDALLANKGADGKISLREAILATNATANDGANPDQIHFNLSTSDSGYVDPDATPGNGDEYWTIAPTSFLGHIYDAVIIDGTTQSGYDSGSGRPVIEIDGINAAGATAGFAIRANDSTIRGFSVINSTDEGIEIDGSTGFGDNNTIQNNWIGVDAEGNVAGNTEYGMLITAGASGNLFGGSGTNDGNVVAGNGFGGAGGFSGVMIRNVGSDNNVVEGNLIGLAPNGTTVMANDGSGVQIIDLATGNRIGTDGDGNNDAAERNVISGNNLDGIRIESDGNTIAGNYIGTDETGLLDRGNLNDGIGVYSGNNTIGGDIDAERNVISGNDRYGIYFTNAAATGNTVSGNYIGVDAGGTGALGNTSTGILIDWQVTGNLIGGTAVGDGNTIAHNGGAGISIVNTNSTGNSFLGNSIHTNTGIGIDLGDDGRTDNDDGDSDSGANDLQNFPVLWNATFSGTQVTLNGMLDTNATTQDFRIEFFASASEDSGGHGEAERYLGFATVTTDGSGDVSFTETITASVAQGEFITATATRDNGGGNYGGTSEFGENRVASGGSLSGAIAAWAENGNNLPEFNVFDGTDFGTEGSSSNLGQLRIMQGAEAPTRDETIIVGIEDGSKDVVGQIWNGSSWSPFSISLGTAKKDDYWSVDVAYENVSGDAVVVWDDNGTLKSAVWDGSSWTGPSIVSAYTGGDPNQISLAASPDSDEMVLVVSDNNKHDFALVWDGNTWGNQSTLTTSGSQDHTDVSVVYEQQSGDAMVVYAKDQTEVHYRLWDGSTWSSEGTITEAVGAAGKARWTTLAADPTSDRIGLGVLTESNDAYFAVWDGSTWSASDKVLATTDTNERTYPNIAVAFESGSGELLATYGENDNLLRYRTWSSGGGWSSELTGPDLGDKPTSMTLDSDPQGDRIMLSVLDEGKDVNYVLWDGSGWGTPVEHEVDAGHADSQPFVFVWQVDTNDAPVLADVVVALNPVLEDAGPPSGSVGTLISDLVDLNPPAGGLDNVTDADAGAVTGVAITAADSTNGTWHYTTDGGSNWNLLGAVSDSSARLLAADANTRVYFEPGSNFNGTLPTALTFRAWDQSDQLASGTAGVDTSTNGGETAFSIATDTASLVVSPVNDSPTIATNTGITVAEGAVGEVITTAMLNEGDIDDSGAGLTYTVTSVTSNGTLFLAGFGALGLNDSFTQADIDAGDVTYSHDDSETTSDAFGFSLADGGEDGATAITGSFSITVTPVNDNNPVITSDGGGAAAALNVAENSTVVTTITATDADLPAQTLVYSIVGGADSAQFAINSSSGVLSFVTAPNSESPSDVGGNNVYDVIVQVSDGTLSDSQSIAVTVTDVDEFDVGAVSDTDGTTNAVDENATVGTVVGIDASASDADATNNTITYSLQDDDGGRFTINSTTGVVTVAGAIDRETDGASRNITVRATSSDGSFTDQVFAIGINDVDEFDVGTVSDTDGTTNAVDENATVGTVVGIDASASDADATNNTITYSLQDDDGGRFTINATTGIVTVNGAIDREADGASRNITVRATSSDGSFTDQVFAIGINDVDEFDVGTVSDTDGTANAVDENATVGTIVGIDASASDADATNNTITYSLQDDDGGRFAINSSTGIVTVAGAIDREADGAIRNITVRATSSDGSFTDQVFSIGINDVDEFDVGTVSDTDGATNEVAENATVGTVVGIDASATDADATNNTITYSLFDDDGGRFAINSSTGIVTVNGAIDRETDGASRNITVRATSSDGSFTDQVFAIGINDLDEFDVGAVTDTDGATNEVAENATVGTVVGIDASASDADATNNTITYSLQDNDGGRFAINSSTGIVTVAGAINRETDGASRNITVRATSSDGSFTDQVFAIGINDLDEFDITAVSDTDGTTNEVTENASIGTTVGITASASDADSTNSSITYTLDDDAGGLFAVNASTGEVTVAGTIDYESATSHDITVRATSADTSFSTQTFTVSVNGVNDNAPVIVSNGGGNSATVFVSENLTSVTTVFATDADLPGQTISYSIVGGADAARFNINSSTGALTFVSAPDFEAPTDSGANNVYEVTVQASDGAGGADTQSIDVTVLDNPQILDQFNSVSYSNNDGDENWLSSWTEIGESNGPSSGRVRVSSSDYMYIGGDEVSISGRGASRAADLTGATTAILSFDYRRVNIDGGGGSVSVQVSGNGGSSWTNLATYSLNSFDGSFVGTEFDISAFAGADTQIRFIGSGSEISAQFRFDNVAIEHNGTASNAAPTISSNGGGDTAAINIAENSTAVTTVTATDTDVPTQTLTYSISGGDDAARFSINSSTGALSFIAAPNYESPTDLGTDNVYNVAVSVADGFGGMDTQYIDVTVTDIDEFNVGPVSDTDVATNQVTENATIGTTVGVTAFASDADGTNNTITYSLTDNDGGRFAIDSASGVVTVAGAIDRETDGASRNITVRATSADGSFTDQIFTIGINDADEFDVGAVSDANGSTNEVDENATVGTVVGITADASDDDATNNTITYSLQDDDGGRFAINATTGVVTVNGAIDRETDGASRNITVRATSADGSFTDQVFAIGINDVDEFDVGPISDTGGAANEVDENATVGTVVGIDASATDADATNNTITYSLQDNDGGRFAINATTGVVTVNGAIDREADGASRNITIRATSSDGSFTDQVFAIGINDVDEFDVGAVTDTDAAVNEVDENSSVGTTVGITALANDADATTNAMTFSLQDDDGGRFAINSTTGVVTVNGAIDRETDGATRNITVRATSADGSFTDQVMSINVNDVDEFDVTVPTDTDAATNEVDENVAIGTTVGITADAFDSDATTNTITYSLTSNPDGLFQIDSSTGVVTTAAAIDREAHGATRAITVQAQSADGSTQTQVFNITINDLDEFDVTVPTDTDAGTNEVDENAAVGTTVGITASASDADATTNGITYTLQDDDGGRFTINSSTGVVTVAGAIDREADGATRNITVRATSTDGSFTDQGFAININDVDEFDVTVPTDTDAATNEVDENVAIGTTVGVTADAFDSDATTNAITYSLTSNPDGLFQIDSSTGVVTTAAAIDRETHGATRAITVQAQSADGSTQTQVFNVTINDLDEFDVTVPTDTDAATNEVDENVAIGTTVGITADAFDSDATTNAITYSLTSNPDGLFQIDASTGVVTTAAAIDRETHGATRAITVQAQSADGSTQTQVFNITINDLDEFDVTVPTDTDGATNEVDENVAIGTTVGITADAFDSDATNNTITYSLTSNPDGLFQIDSSTGVVTTAAAIDREAHGATRAITVQAQSADGSTQTQVFNITINDLDEFDVTVPTDTDAATNEVDENVAIGTTVGITADAFDSDATTNTITYGLASNPDGLFQIDSSTGVVTTAAAIDREVHGATRAITVQAQSADGSTQTQVFNITINDLDEFDVTVPTDTDAATNEVDENVAIGTTVGITADAFDSDATTNTITYSLTSNPDGLFQIDASTGVVTTAAAIDREVHGATRAITVQAQSADGSTQTQVFNITINDLDEFDVTVPTDSDAATNEVDENVAIGTTVGITADAFDSDATTNTITYSLTSNPDGLFQIDSSTGVVTTAAAIDREAHGATRAITVQAQSADGSTQTQVFNITINDLDEFDVTVPTDTDTATNEVDENVAIGTTVGVTADAFDSDATTNTITYSLTSNPDGLFQIDASTGVVTTAAAIDRETHGATRAITVQAQSADGSTQTQVFNITINDLDEFDVGAVSDVDGSTNEVNENAAVGTTVGITASASDSDATTNGITYSLQDDDSGRFTIHSSTGVVTVAGAIDREADGATRNITVRATSADGSFTDQVFAININDVDEFDVTVPTDTDAATNEVDENVAIGTTVGVTADAFDSDATTNVITYSLTSNPDGLFQIDSSTGVVTTAAAIDREVHGATRAITVQAQSADGSTQTQVFNITINDLDEFDVTVPTDTDTATNEVDENVAIGTTVGITADSFDSDATTNAITYSLTSNPDGLFQIDSSTGVVTTAAAIDREVHGATRAITVQAQSADGSTQTQVFNITINDINETPTLANNSLTLLEGEVAAVTTAAVSATDVDDDDSTLTFNVSNVTGGHFGLASTPQTAISSFTQAQVTGGQVVFVHDGGEAAPSYDVSVSDGNTSTAASASAIVFTNVNDAPQISALGGDAVTVPNDGTVRLIDTGAAATLQDADQPAEYGGATLTITGTGFAALDLLGIDTSGVLSLSGGVSDGSILRVSGVAIATLSGTSHSSITISFNANADSSDVDAVLRAITFETTSATLGNRCVDVTFNDGDGTANGGSETSVVSSINIFVASANDGLVTATEDTTYQFVASDFDFTGLTGSDLDSITIKSLPGNGTLTLSGIAVTVNQEISRTDIDAGLLEFTPDLDANGVSYASFDFYTNNGNESITILAGEPNSYTLGGGALAATDQILADANNFGSGGTYATSLLVTGTSTTIDASYLSQGQIFFNGFVPDANWTAAELTALDSWVQAGGVLISNSDHISYDAVSDFYGLNIGGNASTTWHVDDASSPIMNGPFGLVGNNGDSFSATGAISYFDSGSLAAGDQIIAVDSVSGEPTIVLRQHGSGYILFTSDEGIFRAGMTGGGAISTPNDILAANVFAWAAEQVPASTSYTMRVDVDAVNDDPTNQGTLPTDVVVNEDVAGNVDLSAMDLSDVDSASGNLTVTLTTTSGGILTAVSGGGVTVGGSGSGTLSLSGTQTDLNSFFDDSSSVQFTGAADAFGNDADQIQVQVTDNGNVGSGGGGTIDLGAVNVDITAVNDSPNLANNTGMTVLEGSAGTIITTAMLNEADVDDSGSGLTFTITDATDFGTLYLQGSGTLGLNDTFTQADIDAGLLRYDHDDSETTSDGFTFSLADGGEDGSTPVVGTFNITITPVNDNSTSAITDNDAGSNLILENSAIGSTVGITAFASDEDAGDTISYSLDDDDSGRFAIDANTGIVTVNGAIDREADGAARNITVRATSTDGSFQTQVFAIAVADVNEFNISPVVDVDGVGNIVAEDATVGTAVGITASASDADATTNGITYSLLDDDGGRFAVDANSGVVTVAGGIDREADGATRNITVRAISDDGSFADQTYTINITDVDEFDVGPVTDSDTAANEVNENAANGTVVGVTALASDADATTNAITYSLDDNAGGRFAIHSVTGVVSVANGTLLDREVSASHNITVRATSSDGSFNTVAMTINVLDVDEFDVGAVSDIDGVINEVDENAAVGTTVGITASASDDDATTNGITYTLQDDDGGRFTIDSASGVVTVAGAIDREADGATRNITVRATSADGSFTDQVFTININDVDEFDVTVPTDTDGATNEVDENVAIGTTVGITADAFDSDATNNTITYSLTSNPDGLFQIDSSTGVVTTAAAIDREAHGATRAITVQAQSADGSTQTQVFNITINDVDEFDVTVPTDTDGATNEVDENVAIGTTVGITADAFDSDATTNTITYSLTSNPDGLFQIDSSTGVVTTAAAIDREAHGATRAITVRAQSADGSIQTQVFNITINDLDEFDVTVPTDTDGATNEVDENVAIGTTVGITADAFDSDATNNTITYSLTSNPDGLFQIDSSTGVVTTAAAIDRETHGATRAITVQAQSADGSTQTQVFNITINDLDEFDVGPISDSDIAADTVAESAAIGTSVGVTVLASDADATNNTITYSLDDNAGGRFAIDSVTGEITVNAALDYETNTSHSITVRAASSDGSSSTQAFTINVTDVSEFSATPVVDNDGTVDSVAENAAAGTTVGITAFSDDADGTDTISYSLDDNDGGRFAIDASTGIVTVAGAIDREADGAMRNITVRATSTDGSFQTRGFTIAITDVDEFDVGPVTDNDAATNEVNENAANGTVVGVTALASDADATTSTITYTLDDNAGGRFAIDSVSGVVTVADGTLLNREAAANHNLTVRATSSDGSFNTAGMTINVLDVDEFDVGAVSDTDGVINEVDENAAVGTTIGITASASDADATTNSITYTLQDDDGGRFTIDSSTGVVTVAGAIDREADGATRNITVRATSADGSFTDQVFTINVNDVDEFDVTVPTDNDAATNEVDENVAIGTTVGVTADAFDSDATTNAITYSLTSNPDGLFQIDSSSGVVTTAAAIDREAHGATRAITVQAQSADGSIQTQVFNITINDLDEFDVTVPTDSDAATNEVDENVAIGTTVGVTADAFDSDATTNTITYSLTSNPDGLFQIDASTGVVTTAAAIDREAHGASRAITVQAQSADGSIQTQVFNITINDLDEFDVTAPTDTDAAVNEVDENVAIGTTVGVTADAFDSDATTNTITYSLTSNPDGLFQIDASTGVVTTAAAIDREAHGATRAITVQAQSADGSIQTQVFNITINDLDEFDVTVPTDTNAATNEVDENVAIGTTVGITADAFDSDATTNTITYSLTSNPDGLFQIDASTGVVTTAAAIDREAHGATRAITVQAQSADGSIQTQVFNITINDLDEFDVTVPTDTNAATNEVDENVAIGTTVGITADAFDSDATTNAITYSLTSNPDGLFQIDASTGVVTTATAIDREAHGATRAITVQAQSADGSIQTQVFNITINDLDEFDVGPVTDTDAAINTVAENSAVGTVVGVTASASDADATNDTITYTMVDNDGGRFAVDAVSGVVTVAGGIDREADGPTRSFTVRATSADGSFTDQVFSVNIDDVDEFDATAVVDVDGAVNQVAENAAIGTSVGITASSSDADATTNSITYSLDDNDGGRFAIDTVSGEVTVSGVIDREADGATRNITVRATSADGSFATTVLTIAINDVDEFDVTTITDVDAGPNSVAENSTFGTVVGVTAFADDADFSDSVSYSLDDSAAGRFAIDSLTGVVTVSGGIDFETSSSHNITVRATSTDGSSSTQVFTVGVTDVNEAPEAAPDAFSVTSGSTLSVSAPGVIANDSDVDGDALATILVTPPTDGTLVLQPDGSLVYTPASGFFGIDSFAYQVTDGALQSSVVEVQVTVLAGGGGNADPDPDPVPEPDPEPESETETEDDSEDNSEIETAEEASSDANSPVPIETPRPAEIATESTTQGPLLTSTAGGGGFDPRDEAMLEAQYFAQFSSSTTLAMATGHNSAEVEMLQRLLQLDLAQAIVWDSWDDSRQDPSDSPLSLVVGSAGTAVGLFSVGYVLWALRGGALLTAMASSLPAWRLIDANALLTAYRATTIKSDAVDNMLG